MRGVTGGWPVLELEDNPHAEANEGSGSGHHRDQAVHRGSERGWDGGNPKTSRSREETFDSVQAREPVCLVQILRALSALPFSKKAQKCAKDKAGSRLRREKCGRATYDSVAPGVSGAAHVGRSGGRRISRLAVRAAPIFRSRPPAAV